MLNRKIMKIEEIEIGSKWEDTLGSCKWNGDKVVKRGLRREVIITNKTSNTIEFIEGRYLTWISLEDFTRLEKSNGKVRFVKV